MKFSIADDTTAECGFEHKMTSDMVRMLELTTAVVRLLNWPWSFLEMTVSDIWLETPEQKMANGKWQTVRWRLKGAIMMCL